MCFCLPFTWRILHHRCTILSILIKFKTTRPRAYLLPNWKLLFSPDPYRLMLHSWRWEHVCTVNTDQDRWCSVDDVIWRQWMNGPQWMNGKTQQSTAGPIHHCDVIMGAMASQTTCLKIVYSTVHSGVDQRIILIYWFIYIGNIKAPRHWPSCGKFTGDRWIPRTNGQ